MASTNIISTDTDGITVPKWQFMWNLVLSKRKCDFKNWSWQTSKYLFQNESCVWCCIYL